jgi:hypothetical protein
MKKIIFTALSILLAGSVCAQTAGINVGGTLSDYSRNYDTHENQGPTAGLQISLSGQYPVTKKIGIRADLSFVQKGDQVKDPDSDYLKKFRVNYGEFFAGPVISLGSAYVFAGPYIATALSGEETTNYSDGTSRTVDVFNTETNPLLGGYSDMLNKFDAGLNIGLGYEINNFTIEAKGGLGLSNFYNTESDWYETQKFLGVYRVDDEPIENDVRVKNIHAGLTIGYRISL